MTVLAITLGELGSILTDSLDKSNAWVDMLDSGLSGNSDTTL